MSFYTKINTQLSATESLYLKEPMGSENNKMQVLALTMYICLNKNSG